METLSGDVLDLVIQSFSAWQIGQFGAVCKSVNVALQGGKITTVKKDEQEKWLNATYSLFSKGTFKSIHHPRPVRASIAVVKASLYLRVVTVDELVGHIRGVHEFIEKYKGAQFSKKIYFAVYSHTCKLLRSADTFHIRLLGEKVMA